MNKGTEHRITFVFDYSYMTDRGFERNRLVIMDNLRRYTCGERMLNLVDIARGY